MLLSKVQHSNQHVTQHTAQHQHVTLHDTKHVNQYKTKQVNLPSLPQPQHPRYAGLVVNSNIIYPIKWKQTQLWVVVHSGSVQLRSPGARANCAVQRPVGRMSGPAPLTQLSCRSQPGQL